MTTTPPEKEPEQEQKEEKAEKEEIHIETETFICENCGGLVRFNISKQKFACESCGGECDKHSASDEKIVKHNFNGYLEREKRTVPFEGMAIVTCQRCGMEISFEEKQIAATCPMCDSTQVATIKQHAGVPPDGIVPFKIDKREAQERFRVWVKSRWFAPNDFKKRYGEGGLKGMYLPFWTYDASVSASYTGRGGRNRVVMSGNRQRIVTDWWPVSGVVRQSFDDVQVCASSSRDNIEGILPYGTVHSTKSFSAGYLAGYYAEVYKTKADTAFNEAKAKMEKVMRSLAENDIRRRFDRADVHTLKATYSNVTYKHMLLPMWESAFGYGGKVYQYLINGETGKVSGNRPYSKVKIASAVLGVVAAVGVLLWYLELDIWDILFIILMMLENIDF